MRDSDGVLPRWTITRWLVECAGEVPAELRPSLVQGLYGALPIFLGGVLNTVFVSSIVATRIATIPFFLWAAFEIGLAALRLPLLISGTRAAKTGGRVYIDLYILAAVGWAASVGYGCFITVMSGDWLASTLVVLSAAAMAGGVAFRNFAAPRLVMVMIVLSLGPCALAGVMSGEPILLATGLQIPMYIYAMTMAAYRLNAMLVQTMRSEHENKRRARQDALTGLMNRSGLEDAVASRANDPAHGLTLFYIDLDGFKAINDTLGHGAGDELLVEVGRLMRRVTPATDVIARIGGDEFVILAEKMEPAAARQSGQSVIDALSETAFFVGGTKVTIGASVGIAIGSADATDFSTLLLDADRALYVAKVKGRNRAELAPSIAPNLYRATGRASDTIELATVLDVTQYRPAIC